MTESEEEPALASVLTCHCGTAGDPSGLGQEGYYHFHVVDHSNAAKR
jgi:hypothetical protein